MEGRFTFQQGGRLFFRWEGLHFFLSGGVHPMGGISFDGEGFSKKNCRMGLFPPMPPTIGNPGLLLLVFSPEAKNVRIFIKQLMLILSQVMLVVYTRYYFLNPMMIGYKLMGNSILSCFGTMIYIFLKLVIKNLQLHYSILFHCVTHLSQHHSI